MTCFSAAFGEAAINRAAGPTLKVTHVPASRPPATGSRGAAQIGKCSESSLRVGSVVGC